MVDRSGTELPRQTVIYSPIRRAMGLYCEYFNETEMSPYWINWCHWLHRNLSKINQNGILPRVLPKKNAYRLCCVMFCFHDDVIKWKHFPRYWPFVRGIHRSPVNSPHKGQWLGALTFSLICVWINGWVDNREAGDLRRYRAHYDVTVMPLVAGRFYPCPSGSLHWHRGNVTVVPVPVGQPWRIRENKSHMKTLDSDSDSDSDSDMIYST